MLGIHFMSPIGIWSYQHVYFANVYYDGRGGWLLIVDKVYMLVTQDAYVYDELLWCTNLTLPVFSINYPEKPIRVRHSVLTSSVEGGGRSSGV